jgi:hypothetical protein
VHNAGWTLSGAPDFKLDGAGNAVSQGIGYDGAGITGTQNITITAKMTVATGIQGGNIFAIINNTTFDGLYLNVPDAGNVIDLKQQISGIQGTVGTPYSWTNDGAQHTLVLTTSGTTATVKLDGTTIITATIVTQTYIFAGLQAQGVASTIGNVAVAGTFTVTTP